MDRMTMKIDGMSCGHCVSQVKTALEDLDRVDDIAYDPATTPETRITQAIEEQGYHVVAAAR